MLVGMDWDWTSAYPLPSGEFRWSDGLVEFFKVLVKLKVPFLYTSGGDLIRNENVLRNVDLGEHGQLFELSLRILSKADIVQNSAGGRSKTLDFFSQVYTHEDMIHVDDQIDYLLNSDQNRSLLYVGPTYTFVDDYDEWRKSVDEKTMHKYDPPSKEAWALERNKLAFSLGVLLQAREDLLNHRAASFQEAVYNLLRDPMGQRISPHSLELRHFYFEGAEAMAEENPDWQKVVIPPDPNEPTEEDCSESLRPLMG
jgi:hypothetical protein